MLHFEFGIAACWHQAHLDRAHLEHTYLEHPPIRHLLTTGNGSGQPFDRLDLRGVNLQDANLSDASLMGTNLSNATLQGADLCRANLVQARLYGANLAGACLTGAYIQNWGISTDTQLEDIKCDYVYTRLPTRDDPDPCRKPDKRGENFKTGDFSDFIAPIIKVLDLYKTQDTDPRQLGKQFKTLDLVHHQGIDPTAAAIAVTQLAEEHPEARLELITLEGRGRDKIRLQAIVDSQANRSELYTEYREM